MTTLVCIRCKAELVVEAASKRVPWLQHRINQAKEAGWALTNFGWFCGECRGRKAGS